MKVKGLRWVVIGLIMLITIINYLDRGTLNYMWVANIDYHLISENKVSNEKENYALLIGEQYVLMASNGDQDSVKVVNAQIKKKGSATFVTHREGMEVDGLEVTIVRQKPCRNILPNKKVLRGYAFHIL